MTSPLDGGQNDRGRYVGPENPFIKSVAYTTVALFLGLILLGLDMAMAWFLCQVFFSGHSFHTTYVLTILSTLALLLFILRLGNGYYDE